ncbi:Transcription factor WhiB (plasmid) [Mycobacterium intracellulare subsp. chimaera]|uniref:Transcription factor WhiB n=1 Tax=Mycobacterium intracellulare subsp. chimaera TaxID=222805 RepID=A0A7U5RYE7_MYCIT|nr:Transcription factor WhiB [Mycobacterium intracellulare subsp. chimaera]
MLMQQALFEDLEPMPAGPPCTAPASPLSDSADRAPSIVQPPLFAAPQPVSRPVASHVRPCVFDPEAWHDESRWAWAEAACKSCPFLQSCAQQATDFYRQTPYHLSGVWAGVAVSETDRGGKYQRKIKKLSYIATYGRFPPKRQRRAA